MSCSARLAIFGGALEIVGLVLTLLSIRRVERQEFEDEVNSVNERLRQLLGAIKQSDEETTKRLVILRTAHDELRTSDTVTQPWPTACGVETRVERLELVVGQLLALTKHQLFGLRQRIDEGESALRRSVERIEANVEATERARRAQLRGSLLVEKVGAGLFILGAAMSAASNVA